MTTDTPLALQPPDPAVNIRPVRIGDVSALQEHCWPDRSHEVLYRLVKRARRNAEHGRGLAVVVVRDDDALIGFGQLTLWPQCGELSDLMIAPAYRSQGLGTTVIQHLVQVAREMHVPCLEIGAALRNAGAVALYRRLGFQDSHTVSLNLGHGREPILILRLELTDSTIQTE